MKKTTIALTIVFLFLAFASCSKNTLPNSRYVVKEVGHMQSGMLEASHKDEVNFYRKSHIDESLADTQKTVSVFGDRFVGKYDETINDSAINTIRDYYKSDSSADYNVIFAIDRMSGDTVFFYNMSSTFDRLNEKSQADCQIIADDLLKQLIHGDGFVLVNTLTDDGEGCKNYSFTYSRKVGNLNTTDEITLCITSFGTLKMFSAKTINRFKDVTLPVSYNSTDVDISTTAKLNMIYENTKQNDSINYETIRETLLILSDGTFAILQSVNVTSNEKSEYVQILVELGK